MNLGLLLCLTFLGLSLALDPTPVGANLVGIADYARTLPFVDVVKQCRRFGSPNTPWDGNVPVDALGWPTQDFGVILADDDINFGGTEFSISGIFKSKPNISPVACSASFQNINWVASSGLLTGTIVVGQNQSALMLGFTGTNGGVKNLSVRFSGYSETDVFTKPLISMLKRFTVLRFMDWADTNGNPIVNWADRGTPDFASWAYGPKGGTGAPWEVIAELGNQVGVDIWINVPHMANDEYVSQLAQLLLHKLSPSINVYIEYSNEVWNWQFTQATWNLNAAVAEVQNGDPNRLNYDQCNNKWYWGYRRVALRLKQIVDTFRQVWGQDKSSRIRGVLAGQVVQPLIAQLGLEYVENVFGNPAKWFASIAGAPYFNLGDTNNNPSMTVNDVLNALSASINGMSPSVGVGSNNPLAGNARLALWYGIEMRGYEGGPDTFGPNGIQAKKQATYDPRMRSLVVQYLNTWVSYGFQPLNWFSAGASSFDSQYGTWALTEDMNNVQVPKIEGIDDVRTHSPAPLALGIPVPATLNATEFVGHDVPLRDPYLRYLGMNSTFFYIINVRTAGSYGITVWTSGSAVAKLGINVDNSPAGDQIVETPNTGGDTDFRPCSTVQFKLEKGLHAVRLHVLTDRGYNIQKLDLSG